MPELPVKEVRLSELHLPELTREDIVRSLSEIRRPNLDLPDIERPSLQIRESLAKIDWSKVDTSAIDFGRVAAGVAAIARIGRPIVRSRWTLAVGAVVVVGVATAALLSNRTVREGASRRINDVRARIDARSADVLEIDADLPGEPEIEVIEAEAADAAQEVAETVTDGADVVAEAVEEASSPT